MKHSVNDFVVNQFTRSLTSLRGILKKAEAFAHERKFDENLFLQTRLAPDMFPLLKQVQVACDVAKGAAARLTGREIPAFPDNETTLAELFTRIDKTIEFVKTATEKDFEGYENRQVTFFWNPGAHLTGNDYLVSFALPNFYFHMTTVYAMLRTHGVQLGKGDYLGEMNWKK